MDSKHSTLSAFLHGFSLFVESAIAAISLLPVLFLALIFAVICLWFCFSLILPAAYVIPATGIVTVFFLVITLICGFLTI